MALGSQGHPDFPPRSTYLASGKLPVQAALNDSASFGSSSLARRPDQQGQQYSQPAPQPPQHLQQQGQKMQRGFGRQPHSGAEKEPNPLNELSEEQKEEINEAFSLFDLDRDRYLDYHELRVALQGLGFKLEKPELLHILTTHGVSPSQKNQQPQPQNKHRTSQQQQQVDESIHPKNCLVSYPAFCTVAAERILARDPREEIERAFELFDADEKGLINLEDLKRVARELGETGLEEEELRAMIQEFDAENKGGVDLEDFTKICLK